VYGASDNPVKWWDNSKAGFLGFNPKDSSAKFDGLFPVTGPTAERDDPAQRFQGGAFVLGEPMERKR
jgi:uronate dehydrogenase